MKILNCLIPVIIFFGISLFIIFPLLSPGFILTLDIPSTGKVAISSVTSSGFVVSILYYLLHLVIPNYLTQKVILFLVLILAGLGMYKFLPAKLGIVRYFGGILYAINPFVYERIMAGQWILLLGYSIFPFTIKAIVTFIDKPTISKAIKLAFLSTIMVNTSTHFLLIIFVIFPVYGLIHFFFHRGQSDILIRNSIILGLLMILMNINWILPIFLGNSELKNAIDVFTRDDLIAFQSVEDKNFGLVFNLMSGYGFWTEANNYFISPKNINILWPLFSLALIGISILGAVKLFIENDVDNYPFIITLLVILLISLDLAGGIALKPFANAVFFLYDTFPPLRGLREPQKLIGIVMFFYAFMGSFGLHYLFHKIISNTKYIVLLFFLFLPFVYTPTVFGGFWGQLKPVDYPQSWTKVDNFLKQDKDNFITIFFPWHQYIQFDFNNYRVVANPAPYFFQNSILSSRNYETESLYSHDTRPEALHVEGLLSIEKEGINLLGDTVGEKVDWGRDLSVINVKYIILSKNEDWKKYRFLDKSPNLEKVLEEKDILLYKNNLFGREITYPQENTPDILPPDTTN